MVRSGIVTYGLYPSEEVAPELLRLEPALTWHSRVTHVKTLPVGREISYGGTFVTTRPTVVATIPVGYADGYRRSLSGKFYVLIRGKRAPILGRICMDQLMVDVTDI
jgi:alanine racemase